MSSETRIEIFNFTKVWSLVVVYWEIISPGYLSHPGAGGKFRESEFKLTYGNIIHWVNINKFLK